jgi:predicted porin
MTRNRVWIAVVAGFLLSSANLVFAQNVTPSTNNSDAMVDVLKTLESKGVLTPQEFETLKAKVTKDEQQTAAKQASEQQAAVQQAVQQAAPQLKTVAMPMQADTSADNGVTMMSSGVGFHTGRFDVTFTGEVNGFYMNSRPDTSHPVACDLCLIDQSPRTSESIRSGLLPSDFSIKIATQEHGWDVAVFFGIWPAIQNNSVTPGVETGLNGTVASGTSGIDFRQNFVTLGRPHVGTLKIGRDLGLFGQEAILNDMTLLGAGSTNGNNITPNNVTFGRIGVGYIYTDFLPQVTYTTPAFHGLQGAIGVMQPYDDPFDPFNLGAHTQPMYQGKVSYAMGKGKVKAKFWSNFVTQKQTAISPTGGLTPGDGVRSTGVDYGFRADWHGVSLVGYGYNGWGLGLAGLFFDGIGTNAAGNATTRSSQGYYTQLGYQWHKIFTGFSYGQSNLSLASGDIGDGAKVRNNTAYITQVRYGVTKWDSLVAEYTHATSENQARVKGDSDSIALGTIVFF